MTVEKKPRILFISHSYPPIMGGVENQNYNLARGLKKLTPSKIIANGKGKIWLPIFIPLTFIQALFLMARHEACLVGNGVLAPVAAALKFFYPRKKFFSIVHGLDITFARKKGILPKIYNMINIPSLKRLDKLFMVGNFTIEAAEKEGISRSRCVFIPNGAPLRELRKPHTREELSALFGADVADKKVILRLARFVPHKGTDWFINKVMPKLPEHVVMIAVGHRVSKNTAGDPDNFADCEKAIRDNHLENRVKLRPSIPQRDLEILLNTVDLVVAPNIDYPGSLEGFGINAVEAAACERVVLASNIQGLADAIKDGQNGFLVEPENAGAWVGKMNELLGRDKAYLVRFGKQAGKFTEEHFSWEGISQKYLEEINKTLL